jgi:hypothetical protein
MIAVTFNGQAYSVPANLEAKNGWGTPLSNYLVALASGSLQRNGGNQSLGAELNLGATYGVVLAYVKSASSNIASVGLVRLAKTDVIGFRNNANTNDLTLGITGTDRLVFASDNVVTATSTDTLTNKSINAATNTITGLAKTDVGLSNVDNTSDATKNAAVATLTNKTLTSPVINTPTGIVKGDVGLSNVDNTSDVNKPISTATATALALKANLASPTFTGTVVLPSAQVLTSPVLNTSVSGTAVLNENNMASNSTTQVATQASIKAYVDSAVSAAGNVAYSPKSADYTVTTVDAIRTIGMTTGATTRTILLPAAASSTNRILTVVKVDSGVGTVIVDANASELINGQLTKVLTKQYEIVTLQCDGAGWALMDLGLATATAAGLVSLPDSAVMCDTGNGYGSTNARIRRFTNNTVTGTAITYADSATLGASFTINVTGIYCLTWTDRSNATANAVMGFGINSSVTLDIDAQVTAAQMRGITTLTSTNTNYTTSMTLRLTAADVIRAQTDAAAQPNSANATVQFSVVLISKT